MRKIAVLCDFDGTVAEDDVGNRIFDTFADSALTQPLIDKWKQDAGADSDEDQRAERQKSERDNRTPDD